MSVFLKYGHLDGNGHFFLGLSVKVQSENTKATPCIPGFKN